ncbi:MAG: class I SAM-dependent methyltransferase [Chromatiales bacterium]|jgi:SAM-dependent methyltransferase|nr:class I SAM-dependent methyltransferase [Chromatiales bacterium]
MDQQDQQDADDTSCMVHAASHPYVYAGLRNWYAEALGQALLKVEQHELDEILPDLFGYYLVQIGAPTDRYLLGTSLIRHHIVSDAVHPGAFEHDGRVSTLHAHTGALPVRSDSIDVALLHHTLDFESYPHAVLREVERMLVPDGHVVIVGFNPWSLWGMRRLFTWRRRECAPWRGAFRSIIRIKDWLALLGFDIVVIRTRFFRPPLRRMGLTRRLQWMERLGTRAWPYLGGVYIIVAKKRVVTLTPIKPRWRPRRSLIASDAVKPT